MLKGVNFHVYKYSYFLYNNQNTGYILTIFNKVTVNRVFCVDIDSQRRR